MLIIGVSLSCDLYAIPMLLKCYRKGLYLWRVFYTVTESGFRTCNVSYRYTLYEGYIISSECLATFIDTNKIYMSQWMKEWTAESLIQFIRTSSWLRVEKSVTFPHQLFAPRANVEKLLVISREKKILWVFPEWPLWSSWPQYSGST